jgi:hypothetical protein
MEKKESNFLDVGPSSIPNQLLITDNAQKAHQKPIMRLSELECKSDLLNNIQDFMERSKSAAPADPLCTNSQQEERPDNDLQVEMNLILVNPDEAITKELESGEESDAGSEDPTN